MKLKNNYRFPVVGGSLPPTITIPTSPTKSEQTLTTIDLNQNNLFSRYNKRSTVELNRAYKTLRLDLLNSFKRPPSPPVSPPKSSEYSIFIPPSSDCWYLGPPHLKEMNDSQSPNYNLDDLRDIYYLGDQIDHLHYPSSSKNAYTPIRSDGDLMDYDANRYYPVTLTETFRLQNEIQSTKAPPATATFSPPGTGIPKFNYKAWQMSSEDPSPERWYSTKNHVAQSEFEIADGQPLRGVASDYIKSPYSTELAKLRLERLRLEEELVKEVKRQNELERIRGPQPKWYELRTPQFHYEAHKNVSHLRSSGSWHDLCDYRMELDRSSSDVREQLKSLNRYDKRDYA